MKKQALMILFLFISISYGSAQNYQWAKSFGGGALDYGYSIGLDAFGNNYTMGVFEQAVDFDPGAGEHILTATGLYNRYILKTDPSGNFLWVKQFDRNLFLSSMCIDSSGNAYVTVNNSYGNGVTIYKLNPDGEFIWSKSVTPSGQGWGSAAACRSVNVDLHGNVYTTGYIVNGVFDFDPGAGIYNLTTSGSIGNAFVLKLNSNGDFIWAKIITNTSLDLNFGVSLFIDKQENVYTKGYFLGNADFDPGPSTYSLSAPGVDIYNDYNNFITKWDANGDFIWAKIIGGNGGTYFEKSSIALDYDNNIYAVGYFSGTTDFDTSPGIYTLTSAGLYDACISKLDPDGNLIWVKSIGGAGNDYVRSLVISQSGNIYAIGDFGGTTTPPETGPALNDILIINLDTYGNLIWTKTIGSAGDDGGNDIALDQDENIYITGYFQKTVDFDPGNNIRNLSSHGDYDVFILKLGQAVTATTPTIIDKNEISIYPNPADNIIHINKNEPGNNESSYIITDVLGAPVVNGTLNDKTTKVDISGLTGGLYFLQVGRQGKYKIVKQ